jgi:AcrR family transcriptional regulator
MEGRRERKKRQTREAIAETAVRLFAERGYDEVTIADVAAAADVAVTTVFNHFKTKEDLFFSAFTPPTDMLADRLRDRPAGVGPVQVVKAAIEAILTQMAAPGELAEQLAHHTRVRAILAASEVLQARASHRFQARRLQSVEEIASALTAPEAPDSFAHLVAVQLLALVDGTMCEGERRRRLGEAPPAIESALRPAFERACQALSAGLGDYGVRPG